MKRKVLVLSILIALPLFTNSTSAGNYFENLREDFSDCFQLNGGVGWGIGINVKCTDLITGYAGYAETSRKGLGRRHMESWSEVEGGIPLVYGERTTDAEQATDARLASLVHGILDYASENPSAERHGSEGHEMFNIEAGVTLGVVSIRGGLSLGQFVDFLAAVVGFDLFKDNGY